MYGRICVEVHSSCLSVSIRVATISECLVLSVSLSNLGRCWMNFPGVTSVLGVFVSMVDVSMMAMIASGGMLPNTRIVLRLVAVRAWDRSRPARVWPMGVEMS